MTIFIDFGALPEGLGPSKTNKNNWFLMVFEVFAFFVLDPLGRGFWKLLASILEALGPILGGFWPILEPKMAPREAQEAPKEAIFADFE